MAKLSKEKKLKYGDRDHLVSIKTKSGKEIGGGFFDWLLPRWSVVPVTIGVLIIAGSVTSNILQNKVVESRNEQLVAKIKTAKAELKREKKSVKPSVIYKDVAVQTHNAGATGKAVAESMMTVTKKQHVSTSASVSDDDAVKATNVLMKSLDKSASEWSKVKSWLKRPDWTLTFESDVPFEGTDVQTMFTIKDGSGKTVGYVLAKYDAVEDLFTNVKTVYVKDVRDLKLDGGTKHE